jgi:hypothetical protein
MPQDYLSQRCQLVLSVGDQIDPEQIGRVPNNAIIVNQAPQLELLKQSSVESARLCSMFLRTKTTRNPITVEV